MTAKPCDNAVMRLLVVEDDPAIAEPLLAGLRHHGFDVVHVATGSSAIDTISTQTIDMVLLDLGLPDIDGLDVCRGIRKVSRVPVIMVTARDDEVDRVVGLELGADDYVVKPFGIRELVARVRAVSRRFDINTETSTGDADAGGLTASTAAATKTRSSANSVELPNAALHETAGGMTLGALRVDHRTHRVTIGGNELSLTPKEFGVLAVLATDPGAVVTRMSLIEQVWDEHWYGPTKTLDVHVAQLRQKLGNPGWIETVRSVGYRLVDPEASTGDTSRPGSTATDKP
jgi:two-component system, OmpR family, response regulator RegX3